MRSPAVLLCLVGLLMLLPFSTRAETILSEAVIGTGGGEAGNVEYTLSSTFGQVATGIMSNESYKAEGGFWPEYIQLIDSEWANQNINNCVLTVTNRGIIGFMDDSQEEGSGFIYPAGGDNQLFLGSLWVGESDTYVANRDYSMDPEQEWTVATDPDGHIWFGENGTSHQDIHAAFTDSAATQPRGLLVQQQAWAWATNSLAIDFVLLQYEIENVSTSPLNNLCVGVYLDLDINVYTQNTGSTSSEHNLVYMTDPSGIHVGVSLLEDGGGYPPLSNLTLVHNPTYVWPDSFIQDEDKYGFLTAGPGYVLSDAPNPDDYSILVAAGPFLLAPGMQEQGTVAIVGGESLEDLLVHAHVAQLVYEGGIADADEDLPGVPLQTRLMAGRPNPFVREALIRFELAEAGEVDLGVYDASGRLVRTLAQGHRPAMRYAMTWDGRDQSGRAVTTGVYFLRLMAGETRKTRRIVCLR